MSEALLIRVGGTSGGGSLGGNMNFTVIGGDEAPTSPEENMLWVDTEYEITAWEMDFVKPDTAAEGVVWIGVSTESVGDFNAVEPDNKMMLYPVDCWQIIDGEWVRQGLSIYQNGEWIQIKEDWSSDVFPSEAATSYSLIETISTSMEWEAPESGYFQVEVFGASGSGGYGRTLSGQSSVGDDGITRYWGSGSPGGGGKGGGYACSHITLNKGDTLTLSMGSIGSGTTSCVVNTTREETYTTLSVTSGANGGMGGAVSNSGGVAGTGATSGGVGSGGNVKNATGYNGNTSSTNGYTSINGNYGYNGGIGGAAGVTGGNVGGTGASVYGTVSASGYLDTWYQTGRTGGSAAFIKIYRGNTNVVDA